MLFEKQQQARKDQQHICDEHEQSLAHPAVEPSAYEHGSQQHRQCLEHHTEEPKS